MKWLLPLLAAGLLTLLVHLPAARGQFLFYDDARFIVRNTSIESLDRPLRFLTDLDTTASADAPTRDIYRPLRTFSYAILTRLFGKDPFAFHLTAVLLHALVVMLLVALLREAGLGSWSALGGGLLFGLHPVTVESVAWICSLGDLECGLFSLLALLLHARRKPIAAHGALVLALLAKEHAVVVPGLWLAWDWVLSREQVGASLRRAVLPGLAIVIGFLIFRGSLGAGMAQLAEPLGGSRPAAFRTMLAGLGFYAGTILLPFGSSVDARVPVQDSLFALPVLLGMGVVALLVLVLRRGSDRERLGVLWFLLALVPVSNLFVPLKIPTADRFLYLPLMGLALGAGALLGRRAALSARLLPLALVVLAASTLARTRDWKDDDSLVAAGLRVDPKSRTWLWAEASQFARKTLRHIEDGNFQSALFSYNESSRLYALFGRSVPEGMPIQVLMEAGELKRTWGEYMERIDQRDESVRAYGEALIAFLEAHRLQLLGKGRVIEEEVEHAAAAAANLCLRLADFENPELDRTIKTGTEMLTFLEQRFGRDVDLDRARFLLAYCLSIRGEDPKKARTGLDHALSVFDAFERDHQVSLAFPRAQCLFYRSVLKDREPDNQGLERAYELYLEASTASRDMLVRSRFHAGRVRCTQARVFGLKKHAAEGRAILESLGDLAKNERIRISDFLQRQIDGEIRSCAAP